MEIKIMDWIHDIFDDAPLAALFLTVALGYIIGKLKIGKFILGGIAGTLIMGVIIGQLGIDIPNGIKSMFFALFIYAVGFQGGPQFIQSLNLRSLNLLTSSFLMTVAGLACVLVAAIASFPCFSLTFVFTVISIPSADELKVLMTPHCETP